MSAIPGLRGTGDWGTDERPKNFREKILFLMPNGDSPIFALSGKAGKYPVDDPEFAWWAESMSIVRVQINQSGGYAAGDTVITVDSPDPTASTMDVAYGNATHLKPGDLLFAEPASLSSFDPEVVEVVSVQSATQFTVRRGANGTTPGSLADDSKLTLMGSAYAEGSGVPRATTRNPIKFSNYTQIFKDSYEISGTADKTTARTGDAWSNDKKRKMFDHSRAIEHTFLFSTRAYETTDVDSGKPKRFTKGIRGFVPSANITNFGSTPTAETLQDALEPLWKQNPAGMGGETRVGWGGMSALNYLGRVVKEDHDSEIKLGEVIRTYGMDFRELVMPWGRLLLKSHPLLSQHPVFKNSLYILDFQAIKWAPLKGRDTKTKDDVQTEDEDVRRGFVMTEGGWFVDGAGVTCGILDSLNA
jgi:hypothetical protein